MAFMPLNHYIYILIAAPAVLFHNRGLALDLLLERRGIPRVLGIHIDLARTAWVDWIHGRAEGKVPTPEPGAFMAPGFQVHRSLPAVWLR
jgi:hypothetical protein